MKSCLVKFWNFLKNEKMPLWLTLSLFVLTAYLTNYLAPIINERFEQQRIVSTFVIRNLDSFSDLSRALLNETSVLNNRLLERSRLSYKDKEKALGQITELQWRAHELDIIFTGSNNLKVLNDYKSHLSDFADAIKNAKKPKDVENIQIKSVYFLSSSKKVMDALVSKAGLKINTEADEIDKK